MQSIQEWQKRFGVVEYWDEGLVVVNTDPMAWRGAWVQTRWPNTSLTFTCAAWWGRDTSQP